MRSLLRSDTAHGVLVAVLLVTAAFWLAHVINRHAEQHGHCAPLAMIDVELPQRLQGDVGGQGGGGVHVAQLACARGPRA